MKNETQGNSGIKLLVKKYKAMFRIPENLNFYSEHDYQIAERKFLKFALLEGGFEVQLEA
ncbi:MAG: hypothetical protein H8E17_06410 [Deltaproteobacteria bacterium]|nr:hypothetical protein [Deltaproteobacteria bacterium]